jgi:hypothetical protein
MGNRCFVPFEGGEIIMMNVGHDMGGGVEWYYSVPVGYEMTLLSVRFQLVVGAIIGPRRVAFTFQSPFDLVLENINITFPHVLSENETWDFFLWAGSQRIAPSASYPVCDALPSVRIRSRSGWGTKTLNIKPGDVYTFVSQVVVRWRV